MKVIPNSILPFKGFLAINLFGTIFVRMSKSSWETRKNSYKMKVMLNHERIHSLQSKTFCTRWLGFYLVYLYYWIINLFKYKNSLKAYYNIPFEIEAFANELDFKYSKSNWKKYK